MKFRPRCHRMRLQRTDPFIRWAALQAMQQLPPWRTYQRPEQ